MDEENDERIVLVGRKACFGLPTACPSCLPVYFYLRFANVSFDLSFNVIHPDSDEIPYVECGDYVAYNNENGGTIESLKDDGIVDLDAGLPYHTIPEWLSMKAMISSWLADAIMYELWVGQDRSSTNTIYFSDLPWPIGKILYFKQTHAAKKMLGITTVNAERRETEIYKRATLAYEAISTKLGEQIFFIEGRPTSLDAYFLGHALFTLQALPETSLLRRKLLEHSNLVKYCENLKVRFLEAGAPSSTSLPKSPFERSQSSSTPRRGTQTNWSSKPKSKPKKEKTEEEKTFRRRAKYFLATQLIGVLVFLSLFGSDGGANVDDDDLDYED